MKFFSPRNTAAVVRMACIFLIAARATAANFLTLSDATVLAAGPSKGPAGKAVTMLVEEIEKRSAVRLTVAHEWLPETGGPTILLATTESLRALALPADLRSSLPAPPSQAEAFAVRSTKIQDRETVCVVGRDARGLLYGIGYLLRKLELRPGQIALAGPIEVASAPRMRWRGHQLGYRPKTNSYDGWDGADWEQYIRDLVIFGINAIELVPPRSDDAPTSPHFPLPPIRMMRAMSQLAADYGLECWVWYPAIDKDYTDPETERQALAEWDEVFRALPRIDAVFVPGGDPGSTPPAVLMPLLERQAANLRKSHPEAGMWVSPQGFSASWLQEWLGLVHQKPAWLTGVVYGPWTRVSLAELRERVPSNYPLRLYPDIAHTMLCQYPVPDWDSALVSTLGREPIAPRPQAMANILRRQIGAADGFISYSEGCNDDVNKAVWSALSWNPDTEVPVVLRDYARYYLSPDIENEFARGLLALEDNWRGALISNESVDATLHLFQGLERGASPRLLHNWRFQQALYRAYLDAYTRHRLIKETAQERQALGILGNAAQTGSSMAMDLAEAELTPRASDPTLTAWRTRIFQLAEALFQSIKMQLSVPLYQALAVPRGANLDTIDLPLNDRGWLQERFAEIRGLPKESARIAALEKAVDWQNPGPGGFYDDLGNLSAAPHLVTNTDPMGDPEYRTHPLATHTVRTGAAFENWRASWWDQSSAFYDSAVEMRYRGLDPKASYRIRVVYIPTFRPSEIRLEANSKFQIHPAINPGTQNPANLPRPREFEIPAEATGGGELRLRWTVDPNAGDLVGFGQIGEVWLIKVPTK